MFFTKYLPGDLKSCYSLRDAHTDVGDSEYPGGMTSYCSEAAKYSEDKVLSSDFWNGEVSYIEGQGVNGKRYAQRMSLLLSVPL